MRDAANGQGWGLAGLLMNFIKLVILLVITYQMALEKYLDAEIKDLDLFVLNATSSVLNVTEPDFLISFYAAALLKDFNQIILEVGRVTPTSQETAQEGAESKRIQWSWKKTLDWHPGLYRTPFSEMARKDSDDSAILDHRKTSLAFRLSFKKDGQQVGADFYGPYFFEVDFREEASRKYEMYIVRGQWNFLPNDLRRDNVSFALTEQGSVNATPILSTRLGQTLEWNSRWGSTKIFSGQYTEGDEGNFTLEVYPLENRPPLPIVGKETGYHAGGRRGRIPGYSTGVVYPRQTFDGSPNQGYKDWFFVLTHLIVDPDGVAKKGVKSRHGTIPKPNPQSYSLTLDKSSFERSIGDNKVTVDCPYDILARNNALLPGHILLISKENPLGFEDYTGNELDERNYDQVTLTAKDLQGQESIIEIRITREEDK